MYSAQDTLDAIRKEKYKKTYPFIISQGYVITRYENNNNILLVTDVSCGFVYFVRPIQLLEIEHQMPSVISCQRFVRLCVVTTNKY